MSPYVLCTCRSHCSTHDPQTGEYHGGQLVNRNTAYLHRKDDSRSPNLNKFSTHIASSILEGSYPLGLPHNVRESSPLGLETQPQELLTLEQEIRDRISWSPTRRPLVFANSPIPDTMFENPLLSPDYVPNAGTCALLPSHPYNLSFIENENRLYEIRVQLERFRTAQETCEQLSDHVNVGLQRMMEHKKDEWDRQGLKSRAIASGLVVVNTGKEQASVHSLQRKLIT